MKKALMNASVASMIYKFNMTNIKLLEDLGYKVDVACNFGKENPISQNLIDKFKEKLDKKQIMYFNTCCPRNVLSISKILKTYRQLRKLADTGEYSLVHTQSPIGGVICRLAFRKARKNGTKVIYQVHGFHFFKGAPKLNWMIFYPIEKICAYFTDTLITINLEDYNFAQKKLRARKIEYVPGVGIDLNRFCNETVDKSNKRKELDIPQEATVLLSVGELNDNKNHETVIKAIASMNVYYLIAGQGEKLEYLKHLSKEVGMSNKIKFLGYRQDVNELYAASDIFIFPSFREGLAVSVLEAMAFGLPCVISKIRGNTDLIDLGGGELFEPSSVDDCRNAIKKILLDDLSLYGKYNQEKVICFSLDVVKEKMVKIYEEVLE